MAALYDTTALAFEWKKIPFISNLETESHSEINTAPFPVLSVARTLQNKTSIFQNYRLKIVHQVLTSSEDFFFPKFVIIKL